MKTSDNPAKLSKSELARVRKVLRYMSPENIAKDFKGPKERAAIAAVLKWLSLNGVCAWEQKRGGTYSTNVSFKKKGRGILDPYQAVVVDKEAVDKIKKLFPEADED